MTDPVDEIAAALSRLRGRRGPRGPGAGMPHGGPPFMHGGPHGHGGPHHAHGERRMVPPGPPPWVGRGGGPARFRLLEALGAADHPLTVSEVADAIGVDQPRASRLVQQCVAHRLVVREADPEDARRIRLVLTDDGTKLVRAMRGDKRDAVASALESFTDAERAELARLLTKLADAWPG